MFLRNEKMKCQVQADNNPEEVILFATCRVASEARKYNIFMLDGIYCITMQTAGVYKRDRCIRLTLYVNNRSE